MNKIKGTHDSGTYNLSLDVCPNENNEITFLLDELDKLGIKLPLEEIRKYAKTQTLTFYEQLVRNVSLKRKKAHVTLLFFLFDRQKCSGARYLDIRVAYDVVTNTWRTHHFLLSNDNIPNMLKDVLRFVRENTEEVLVLEFRLITTIF